MAAAQIIPRFNGHDIARHQWPGVNLFGDAVWVFMDKKLMPHAMSRAVIVIQPHFPQRTSRESVQLMPVCAGWELQGYQRQEASQYGGIMHTLLRGNMTPGKRARGVSGAVSVLTTRIIQVKMIVADGFVAGFA